MSDADDHRKHAAAFTAALDLMAALRDPRGGCPWDREQTFESIAPYTVEEAYEVADAVARGDPVALCDELGDLLFQVLFHARIAEELRLFDASSVARQLVAKMRRRHPHVFAGEAMPDVGAQNRRWDEIKARERGSDATSALDGVGTGLAPMRRAWKIQRRAARCGFDWDSAPQVLPKIDEELAELGAAQRDEEGQARVTEELGDVLFSLNNLARHLDVDPELALIGANIKFERRFRAMERLVADEGSSLATRTAQQLETLWSRVKSGVADTDSAGPSSP